MTAEDAFVALVGDRLIHRTAAGNAATIRRLGLLSPETLARLAGIDPRDLILRRDRVELQIGGDSVRLNHQLPLCAGRTQEALFLDGHTLETWAAQLDGRVFFWPSRGGGAFAGSLEEAVGRADLVLDARRLFRLCGDRIDLSPINSGNARRRATRRGDWLYVPATRVADFRDARRIRGEVRCRDAVAEVSLRGDLSPEDLAACLLS